MSRELSPATAEFMRERLRDMENRAMSLVGILDAALRDTELQAARDRFAALRDTAPHPERVDLLLLIAVIAAYLGDGL